ncbi:MAG: UDP-N-acetylglucosamine 2-epimerase (non-hydrolyzing) [Pseudohongiellaceae bacterium]|jgi:UDP-N-acetylglucosamine 2-epimerase (non-hydrolysing)
MGKTVLCVVGTRPEVIKMAPVILRLQQQPGITCRVLATAQHRGMMDQMLDFFGTSAHIDLNIMVAGQTLPELTARLITGVSEVLRKEKPDLVLGQGDTTTVLATALAAFYERIPFGHVEAGLRTHDLQSPFPEEANRMIAGRLAAVHFAPTDTSRDNLLGEGHDPSTVHVTGNPVIDALLIAVERQVELPIKRRPNHRLLFVTTHRRENFGSPLASACVAIRRLVERFDDVEVLWPLHPNPAVGPVVRQAVGGHERIHLVEPLTYGQCATAMDQCEFVLTDSGGIQEEAPALHKPVLVLRESTERPEGLQSGAATLVGLNEEAIFAAGSRLLADTETLAKAQPTGSPYGDGLAAMRIANVVNNMLNAPGRALPPETAALEVPGAAS